MSAFGIEENVSSPDLDWNATQDNKETPSPQSEVSFWAHTSSVEAYCRHYGKTVIDDGPVPKWRFRSLYANAPMTFSGPTPPKKRKLRKDLESARPSPPKKRRLSKNPEEYSPASSPCENLILR
jgi:hypothetical protein